MQPAVKTEFVRVADYLAAEETSKVRHEYLGGLVYGMAGETTDHNTITLNLAFAIRQHLKDKPCRLYMSDIRVNFDLRGDEYFYYPDLVVTCDRRDNHKRFVRHPKLIVEVLSEGTGRVDKREKFFAYTSITSLEEYVLVAQATREVTVFRRADDWKAVNVAGSKVKVALESLRISAPFSVIYEGV